MYEKRAHLKKRTAKRLEEIKDKAEALGIEEYKTSSGHITDDQILNAALRCLKRHDEKL